MDQVRHPESAEDGHALSRFETRFESLVGIHGFIGFG
jgi:hypothetical protein